MGGGDNKTDLNKVLEQQVFLFEPRRVFVKEILASGKPGSQLRLRFESLKQFLRSESCGAHPVCPSGKAGEQRPD